MLKPTILILTTHTGGGHLNLAQSLKGMLEPHYEVVIMDPQSAFVDHYYRFVSRHLVGFLDWQYAFTDNEFISVWFHRILTAANRKRLISIVEDVQPQLIITTHAVLSYAMARANEDLRQRVPLAFQLTDLGQLHQTWFAEKAADAYLAPTREIFVQTLKQGIDEERVHLTGRPVRQQFFNASLNERGEILSGLGFDPGRFTLFLQGGAMGSAGVDRTIETLLSSNQALQIILAVGNNKQMAARYAGSKQVQTLPFTEVIAPYMAATDVIVGKAGASFITEAFMVEKPFIVTTFIPGQESPNLRFIEQHNLGWVCLETAAQKELLTNITHNPGMIAEKVAAIQDYKAWNMQANQNIHPIVDRLISDEHAR